MKYECDLRVCEEWWNREYSKKRGLWMNTVYAMCDAEKGNNDKWYTILKKQW